jgi:hypothetical protein
VTHRLSRLASVEYNTEASFAADTSTYATRLQPLGQLDISGLKLNRQMIPILQQRPHEGIAGVRTFYEGPFSLEFLLTGHGATAAGAITATDLATLLGHVVGALRTSDDGGTVDAGSTSTVIQGVSVATMAAGSMCRIGTIADGRGNGQFYPVASSSVPDVTLGFAVDSAPNAADVIYAAQIVHPLETPSTCSTVQSLRFRFATPNEQYEAHGCWVTGLEFLDLDHGAVPRVRISFNCAWWESVSNATFPSSTATAAKTGAPVANGSLVLNTVGTSTRTKYDYQDLAIRINYETIPIRGPGSAIANTIVTDVRRSRCQAMVSFTTPAQGTGDQTHFLAYLADSLFHLCLTLSAEDGKAIGFYFPNLRMTDQTPIQRDAGGLNRVPVEFEALTGQTTTNDLTLSNWRLAMG